MRWWLSLVLAALSVGPPAAAERCSGGDRFDPSPRPCVAPPAFDAREGGETIAGAFLIPGDVGLLPFHDTGATCDNVNDYDEACPHSGSTAPDVVYGFTPSEDVTVNIDLCASSYDTKAYVYAGGEGNLVACNDDAYCGYSGWQSHISHLSLSGGTTCYLVVDGYGTSCGAYELTVSRQEDCVIECPGGSSPEGEPPCVDDHVDTFNGGCNVPNGVWSAIEGGPDGCATICGRSCTYSYQGDPYRDTDWYEATASGGPMSVSCQAEFPLVIYLKPFPDCYNMMYVPAWAPPCVSAELSYTFSPGHRFWLVVSPSVFEGVSESDYVFTICGLTPGATAVEPTTWGRIKAAYR